MKYCSPILLAVSGAGTDVKLLTGDHYCKSNRAIQANSDLVPMTGDGANDGLARPYSYCHGRKNGNRKTGCGPYIGGANQHGIAGTKSYHSVTIIIRTLQPGIYLGKKLSHMDDTNDPGSFLKETKRLVRDYIETQVEIYRLRVVRSVSGAAGYLLWIIITIVLGSLFVIFLGLVTGFWLSETTGSYTTGFGITAGLILVVILLIAVLRRPLFVNPMIRNIIKKLDRPRESNKEEQP